MLVLTDPFRIKTTAAQVTVPYHLPVGVQLVVVYMTLRDFQKLRNDSQRAFSLQNSSVQNGGILPFQLKRKTKARDKSILFSNIPEEEPVNGFNETVEPPQPGKRNGVTRPRPTHLPLRMKNETAREVPESGFSSINFDETDSFPQFIGKTSVCSTPLLENKILHGNLLSICANQVIRDEQKAVREMDAEEKDQKKPKNGSLNLIKNGVEEKFTGLSFDNFRGNKLKTTLNRCTSVRPIQQLFTSNNELSRPNGRPKYQTITDPSYPVFNEDGMPISKYMFDQCGIEVGVDIAQDVESLKIDGFPSVDDEEVVAEERNGKIPGAVQAMPAESEEIKSNGGAINEIVFRNKPMGGATEEKRKSLSLPIQPINLDSSDSQGKQSASDVGTGSAEDEDTEEPFPDKPVKRKRADFPVTPLMSKIIAQLPFDSAWSSGFSSCTLTPSMTPIDSSKAFLRRRSSISKVDEVNEEDDEAEWSGAAANDLQRVELFVCGQHNMTMLIAMEENSGQREELVQSLWETCISRLPKIESNLQQTLNVSVDGVVDKNDMNYSFMCFDPHWDVIQQGGHWAAVELQAVEDIHADFKENGSFTETLVR